MPGLTLRCSEPCLHALGALYILLTVRVHQPTARLLLIRICGAQELPGANGAPAQAEGEGEGEEAEGAPPAKKARTEAGTGSAEVRPVPALSWA